MAYKLWVVNILSFILLSFVTLTGFINWFILPRGYGTRGGFLISLRHVLIEVHQWTALFFVIVVGIHLMLHRDYITRNLKKHGILRQE